LALAQKDTFIGMKSISRIPGFSLYPVIWLIGGLCLITTKAPADTLVVPNYAATNQANNDSEATFSIILREQIVYSASEFPIYPIIISEIRWRPDTSVGGPITTTISNIQIYLSTTRVQPDQLNSIFAQNLGPDNTLVFSGAMHVTSTFTTLSNGTKDFDIDLPLQTPFLFDSSQGSLLVDLHNFTGCNASLYDNSLANIVDAVSRIVNTSDPNGTSASFSDSGGGVIELIYSPASGPPVIASQPTNETVSVGETATFTVVASGPSPVYYQWFVNDTNNPIFGATTNSLTLVNLQTYQGGSYFVRVTNAYGLTFSSNAVLTVSSLPKVTSEPANQTVLPGGVATFMVFAYSVA
jgi:hypothetical protein